MIGYVGSFNKLLTINYNRISDAYTVEEKFQTSGTYTGIGLTDQFIYLKRSDSLSMFF